MREKEIHLFTLRSYLMFFDYKQAKTASRGECSYVGGVICSGCSTEHLVISARGINDITFPPCSRAFSASLSSRSLRFDAQLPKRYRRAVADRCPGYSSVRGISRERDSAQDGGNQ